MSGWVTSDSPGDQRGQKRVAACRFSVTDLDSACRRVLVIDSDLLVAEAIVSALTQRTLTARFAMPITLTHVRDLTAWQPGLALLNVDSIDRSSCMSLISMLSNATIPVAIMGSRLDVPLIGECLDAGVSMVVDKGWTLEELVSEITRVLLGGVGLDDDTRRRILEPIRRRAEARREQLAPFNALTQREKCILAELLEGYGPEAIARRSSVSVLTVRSQVKAILQKLGVNSQLAAVSLARRAGWTLDEPAPSHARPGRALRVDDLDITA